MKNVILFISLLFIAFFNCDKKDTSNSTDYQPGRWEVINSAPTNNSYYRIFMADNNTGWIIGNQGKINKTTNGGKSWQDQQSGTMQTLWSLSFINSSTGWVSGANNTILHTIDGGTSWQVQNMPSDTTKTFTAIGFTDINNGCVVSNYGQIYHTANAGQSWTKQAKCDMNVPGIISFVDSQTGFVKPLVGDYLLKTSDGGLTWQRLNLNIKMNWEKDMFFINPQTGWICNDRTASSLSEDHASVYRTNDGGTSWKLLKTLPEHQLNAICFANEKIGWVAGTNKIYFSDNGGSDWNLQFDVSEQNLFLVNMFFVDESHGWALDLKGNICRYTK